MVQSRSRLRLLPKAPQAIGISRNKRGQDLDGDFTLQRAVARAVHLAHTASAQQADNFVSIELRACGYRHVDRNYISHAKSADRDLFDSLLVTRTQDQTRAALLFSGAEGVAGRFVRRG